MQATKRQVLIALVIGLVLAFAGAVAARGAFSADVLDVQMGLGGVALSVFFLSGLLLRAVFLEIMDAVQN